MRTVAVGEKVLVRLALLPGMYTEKDGKFTFDEPTPEECMQMRLGLGDAGMMQKMLDETRKARKMPDLTSDALLEQLFIYPRVRPATIMYVDRTESKTNWVNLEVDTPGSVALQPAIGKIPKWATQKFRLEQVQIFTKEPDGAHDIHVAYWPPETEEDAPARKKGE